VIVVGPRSSAHRAFGARRRSRFRDPSWHRITDIDRLIECRLRVWPRCGYTARAVAGEEGEQQRSRVAIRARATADALVAAIEEAIAPRVRSS
jgi:hypothetical protein